MQAVEAIFRQLGRPLKALADEPLLVRGTVHDNVYFVRSGQVLLHSTSHGGRQIGFDIFSKGQVFGIASIANMGRAPLDATALTPCDLLVAKLKAFDAALRDNPEALRELLHFLSDQIIRRTRQAEGLALDRLPKRLARWILDIARGQNADLDPKRWVHLEYNQKLMAAMAGVSRETLNRQLHSWVRSGLLAIDGKELRILRPEALIELADAMEGMSTT